MTTLTHHLTTPFSGLWIPIITPFHEGAVDHAALAVLIHRYKAAGVDGIIACGSTGEAASLEESEQLAVLDTIMQASGSLAVAMGVSGYHLKKTLAWVSRLSSLPLAGLLVSAPHYIRPSQTGLLHWFHAIAETSTHPLIVYDVPYRTGVTIERPTMLQLAAHPRIRAVKDCGGDIVKTQALIADGRLAVLAGDDAQIFSTLALGGAGAIAASAHVHTAQFVEVMALLKTEQLSAARKVWQPLVPDIEAVFAQPNPACIKAELAKQGLIVNELREPMTAAS